MKNKKEKTSIQLYQNKEIELVELPNELLEYARSSHALRFLEDLFEKERFGIPVDRFEGIFISTLDEKTARLCSFIDTKMNSLTISCLLESFNFFGRTLVIDSNTVAIDSELFKEISEEHDERFNDNFSSESSIEHAKDFSNDFM